jgi:hypothetical protein
MTGLLLGVLFETRFFYTSKRRYWIFSGLAVPLLITAIVVRQRNPYIPMMYASAKDHDAGKEDEALEKIRAVLQMKPMNITANRIASVVFLSKSDYADAEKAIRIVLASDKSADYYMYLLGIVELRADRCDEANALENELNREISPYAGKLSCHNPLNKTDPPLFLQPSISKDPRFWFGNEYSWY